MLRHVELMSWALSNASATVMKERTLEMTAGSPSTRGCCAAVVCTVAAAAAAATTVVVVVVVVGDDDEDEDAIV